ncbi:hypothetical protein BD779DRAFT_1493238 [Infundibulicybe gibba]|nr:hypothetical protein BD779DRAFT_1493238 [Infundibulicybe gibba]
MSMLSAEIVKNYCVLVEVDAERGNDAFSISARGHHCKAHQVPNSDHGYHRTPRQQPSSFLDSVRGGISYIIYSFTTLDVVIIQESGELSPRVGLGMSNPASAPYDIAFKASHLRPSSFVRIHSSLIRVVVGRGGTLVGARARGDVENINR